MRHLFIILIFICFSAQAQLEKPEVFMSQYEMTPVGGQPYDEFYWFNTSVANLSKSADFTGGTYRFDLSAYAVAGAAQVGMYIDGVLKGTVTVNSTAIAIYSLPTSSITAGTHTVKIQINNFSGSIHCRVGLLYFTKTTQTLPYVYPALGAKDLPASGQYLTKEDFGGGHLRGFNMSGTNHSASSHAAMVAYGANLGRSFVDVEFSGNICSLVAGELTELDTAAARASRYHFYLIPSLFLDPSLNTYIWGNTANGIARRSSVASLWKFLANRYKNNTWVGAYDIWNEPRSNFNYAEVIRFQTDCLDSIRSVDANHVVAIECIKNDMFAMMLPLGYTNIIYSPHGYSSLLITHQGVDYFLGGSGTESRNTYPTSNLLDAGVSKGAWTITNLSAQHADVRIMTNRFHVPIWIGEFSCINWAPLNSSSEWTSTKWVNDNITLLEAEGWSWVYHAWREFEGWDAEIPSQYYVTQGFTYTNAAPFRSTNEPGTWAAQRTSSAPTIVMLQGYFALNGSVASSFCKNNPKGKNKYL